MRKKINVKEYSNYARYWGVPCYYNLKNNHMDGRNRFCDFLMEWWAQPMDHTLIFLTSVMALITGTPYEPSFKISIGDFLPHIPESEYNDYMMAFQNSNESL